MITAEARICTVLRLTGERNTDGYVLATIHDRMPVILTIEAHERWLRSDARPAELKGLLAPLPGMKSFPVSSRVNRPQVDEVQLVEPIDIGKGMATGMLF
jgi:putative SOS response-associated peptidase YedK